MHEFDNRLRLRHAHGVWRDFEVIANNLLDNAAVAGVVLTGRDITERKVFERQLQQLAFHDSLTGLPNRALLTDRLERALGRADRDFGRVALLFIDLDNFKLINDGLGHGAGDRLLLAFANRLRGCVRSGDTAARLGGDEFVLLLEEVETSAQAIEVADRTARLLREPLSIGDREVVVSSSIGVTRSNATNSGWCTNRSCRSLTGELPRSKRWCAGNIRPAAGSRRLSSFP